MNRQMDTFKIQFKKTTEGAHQTANTVSSMSYCDMQTALLLLAFEASESVLL